MAHLGLTKLVCPNKLSFLPDTKSLTSGVNFPLPKCLSFLWFSHTAQRWENTNMTDIPIRKHLPAHVYPLSTSSPEVSGMCCWGWWAESDPLCLTACVHTPSETEGSLTWHRYKKDPPYRGYLYLMVENPKRTCCRFP